MISCTKICGVPKNVVLGICFGTSADTTKKIDMKCYQLRIPLYFGRTDAHVGDTTWHYKGRQDWIILFQKSDFKMKNT